MSHDLVTAPSGITYPVWHAGTGDPLLLLHGFTGSHETWRPLVDDLTRNHLVITLDLPGHGSSQLPASPDWTFASVIDDLAWIIKSLPGGTADVVGYSMGGRLALALAIRHPERVRRLVLESASPGIADDQERAARKRADEQLAARILSDGLEAFVAHWERLPMWESQATLPASIRERQRRIRLGHSAAGLAASLRATGSGAQPSYWDRLVELTRPVLLVAGAKDLKFSRIASRMHGTIPDAWLEIVPSAGHAVHLEQPERYVQLISRFLHRSDSRATQTKGNVRV
jgi:2-succinyl-6-hydroxy-2,4-cyclohexadiene-1-carboxylate synthase